MTSPAPPEDLTRRELLRNAGAAGLALSVPGLLAVDAAATTVPGANVVVVIIDSLRKDHVGAYGRSRARTPVLNRFGREALRFTHARHEAYPTVPVRRAQITGRGVFPFRGWHPVRDLPPEPGWRGIRRNERLWTDVLAQRGYMTGYVTDNPHLLKAPFDPFRRRFDFFDDIYGQVPTRRYPPGRVPPRELRRHLAPELHGVGRGRTREFLLANKGRNGQQDYLTARVFQSGIDFVTRARQAARPFALVVDAFDVHEPWDPPDEYLRLYTKAREGGYRPLMPFPVPVGRTRDLSRRTLRLVRQLYAAEVSMVDAWFGRLLAHLDVLGVGASTWVVFMSDHGVYLGDHGLIGKTSALVHGELVNVPFMIRHPQRLGAGRSTSYYASAHDIGRTVLAGVGAPVPKSMDGANLGPLFSGARATRRPLAVSGWANHVIVSDDRWQLIIDNDGRNARLYDKRRDPGEGRNVARSHPKIVRRFYAAARRSAGGRLPRFASADARELEQLQRAGLGTYEPD